MTDYLAVAGFMLSIGAVILALGCDPEPTQWQPDLDLFPCQADFDCAPSEVCRHEECWTPCEVDEDCPVGFRCGELVDTLDGQGVCL